MNLDGSGCEELLAVARDTAREAAEALISGRGRAVELGRSSGRDVKLSSDRESETLIKNRLSRETGIPILGEEYGLEGAVREDGLRWIVDPLDGTANYQRGFPAYGVSIGLWRGDAPLLGVIADIPRGETFSGCCAGESRGAWLDGAGPIRVSSVSRPEDAFLTTGFPIYADHSVEAVAAFAAEITRYKKVRMLGSAAIMIAYVACGRADIYKERDIAVWDVAAGLAVVLGAGGAIELKPSEKVNCYRVVASNGKIF